MVIRAIADGATAQLRSVVDDCDDRDTARRIHAELIRIASQLAQRHGFVARRTTQRPATAPEFA